MPRYQQTLAIAAILIVAASAAYVAVRHNRQVGSQSGVLPDQQYVSATYGFSFTYPPQYRLNEYTSRYIELQDPATGAALASVEIELADPIITPPTYEEFAHMSAANTCAADGPTGSIRCTDVSRSEAFAASEGTVGEVFYLNYVAVIDGTTTTRESGPYYMFDISAHAPEAPYAAVLVRIAHAAEESPSYDEGAALAHQIAASLRILDTSAR